MSDLGLSRRAVACKQWRWMPGMSLYINGVLRRIVTVGTEGIQFDSGWASRLDLETNPTAYPDFADPATVGCLLALVREAWGDPYLTLDICGVEDHRVWACYSCDGIAHAYGDTEAAALVAALEQAP